MKSLTIKYWNTLERRSKERALSMVYGNQHGIINMHKHLQEHGIYQRISQSMDRENSPVNSLLEQAACIVRRSKTTTGTLESTENYKRGQIEELKSFANSLNLWIDLSDLEITYMDKGGENEVFHDGNTSVIKLNNFEYAGDDLENFFIRIFTHNV